nr:hypothetical protein [Tanacetum cinerariifolium]
MKLYIRGKEHGKDLFDLVLNGPFTYGTFEVPATPTTAAYMRERTYEDLIEKERIREECNIRTTNIVLQGLPPDVYNLFNHHTLAKEIWNRVKLLIEGTELSLQERESKLYDEFGRFMSEKGETIHSYYLRFAQLLNDVNTIRITLQKLQVNLRLAVPSFLPTDDTIASLNKAMDFISTTFASRYPPTNNQLHTLSNPRNQATIQDGRVMVQNIQGRQSQGYASSGSRGNATWKLTIPTIFQNDDLDAFDSDYDEAPSASVVLMAKLSAFDSDVLSEKHDVLFVPDIEETLELVETSRGKMLEKQTDPIAKEKNMIIKPIDYDALNKLSEHFSAHFVPQKELSVEQAFWLPISKPTCEKPPVQPETVPKEIPHELSTISLVKDGFDKMKSLVNNFDKVITIRTKVMGQTEGTWGFKHILGKPKFDNYSVERKCFKIKAKELLLKNERLLEHIVYQDVMCIAMHVDVAINCVVPKTEDTLAYAEME